MDFYSGAFDLEDHALSRINAQMQFLKAVRDYAPDVLKALRAGPRDAFYDAELHESHWRIMGRYWLDILSLGNGRTLEDARLENYEFLKSRGQPTDPLDPEKAKLLTDRLEPLARSIWQWSRTSGLDADWCRARAFFTIVQWVFAENKSYFSDHTEIRTPVMDWSYDHPNVGTPFQFEEFKFEWAWHPGRTSRSVITRVIRSLFEKDLREYLDKTEASFKEQTGIKTKLKEKRGDKHFHWFVLFQVNKLSYSEIVRTYFPKRSNEKRLEYISDDTKVVRKAINELAKFIDLPLRKEATKPGRRPRRTT